MEKQSFKSHTRYVPPYHFFTFPAFVVLLIGGIVALVAPDTLTWLLPVWMILLGLAGTLGTFYSRVFALRAQDRAIRAEENLRYFILSGKRLDPSIRMRQLIALRFASDAEFVALADRAVAEKLEPAAIKAAIQQWRPDFHRA